MYDVEIFAIINAIFQIPPIPYFPFILSFRIQMKVLRQTGFFAECYSRQMHVSVLGRVLTLFAEYLQNIQRQVEKST